jgi:hypothetical protein
MRDQLASLAILPGAGNVTIQVCSLEHSAGDDHTILTCIVCLVQRTVGSQQSWAESGLNRAI